MSGVRTRAAIIVCLVAYAFILGAFSNVLPPLSAVVLKPGPSSGLSTSISVSSSQTTPPLDLSGTLVVKASISSGEGGGFPVPDAMVQITPAGSTYPWYSLETNSSGMVQTSLEAENYSVAITSPSFHATAQAQVYQGRITEVDLVSDNGSLVINQDQGAR